MEKYNVYERQGDAHVRKAQVVYLKHHLNLNNNVIAKITGYAISTVRNYACKFKDLLEWGLKHFIKGAVKVVKKVEEVAKKGTRASRISLDCKVEKVPCAYVLEMFDTDGKFVWLKVGKANDVTERCKEHLTYYKDAIDTIKIKAFFPCADEDDAQTMENELRKYYKSFAECGFIKNDRFSNVRFHKKELMENERIEKTLKFLNLGIDFC